MERKKGRGKTNAHDWFSMYIFTLFALCVCWSGLVSGLNHTTACKSSIFPSKIADSFVNDGYPDCCDASDETGLGSEEMWCNDAAAWKKNWLLRRAKEHEDGFRVAKSVLLSRNARGAILDSWTEQAVNAERGIQTVEKQLEQQRDALDKLFERTGKVPQQKVHRFHEGLQMLDHARKYLLVLEGRSSLPWDTSSLSRLLPLAEAAACVRSAPIGDKQAKGGSSTVVPKQYVYTVCALNNVTQQEVGSAAWKKAEEDAKRSASLEVDVNGEGVHGIDVDDEELGTEVVLGLWNGGISWSSGKHVPILPRAVRNYLPLPPNASAFKWSVVGEAPLSNFAASNASYHALSKDAAYNLFNPPTSSLLPVGVLGTASKRKEKKKRKRRGEEGEDKVEGDVVGVGEVEEGIGTLDGRFRSIAVRDPLARVEEGMVLWYSFGQACNEHTLRRVAVQLVCPPSLSRPLPTSSTTQIPIADILNVEEDGECDYRITLATPLVCSNQAAKYLQSLANH